MTDNDLLLPDPKLTFGSGVIGVCDICGERQAVIVLQKERYQLCVLDFLNKSWTESRKTPGRPLPPYTSERIWFPTGATPSGQAPAITLSPTKPVRRPTVLVTPDVYGLTTMVLDAGIRLAREGFEVLLPDVGKLEGLSPVDHLALRGDAALRGGVRLDRGRARRFIELYLDGWRALRARPMVDPARSGLFGASYGASLAVAVAAEDGRPAAVALASPTPVRPAEYPRLIRGPLCVVVGGADARGRRAVDQLTKARAVTDPPIEVHAFDGAPHLFLAREAAGYRVAPAERAWREIVRFFRVQLLPPPPKPPVPPVSTTAPPPPVAAPAPPPPGTPKPASA